MTHNRPAGEPNYCGVCGVPMNLCDCKQYKEHGAGGATKAGSADTDDDFPGRKMGEKGNGGGQGGENKKPFPGASAPLGKKE